MLVYIITPLVMHALPTLKLKVILKRILSFTLIYIRIFTSILVSTQTLEFYVHLYVYVYLHLLTNTYELGRKHHAINTFLYF